ncbi:hypothetical protein Vadar_015844 [Vaccinium darrowii]|uniref:Uncharacterized protein n=1 Tax=Vaccinium darrowii TaxID=229202 RepID=A0ACB7YVT6_9ERIC|nr:hypothetical protein Vadar_015844 [Vaccinium darrowii]
MAAALNRFIKKSSNRCRPFFQLLKKREGYEWGAEQEQAFQELKSYLSSPPLLSTPEAGERLILYLVLQGNCLTIFYNIPSALHEKEQFSPTEQPKRMADLDPEEWRLYVDGSACNKGSGAGVVMFSPEGLVLEQALRLGFSATNNVAEHEALLAGLRSAKQNSGDNDDPGRMHHAKVQSARPHSKFHEREVRPKRGRAIQGMTGTGVDPQAD